MSESSDFEPPASRKNPLIWIAVAVALVIAFWLVGGERGRVLRELVGVGDLVDAVWADGYVEK